MISCNIGGYRGILGGVGEYWGIISNFPAARFA